MSENVADSNSVAMEDAELKNALLAAFGADAMDFLDEVDDGLTQLIDDTTSPDADEQATGPEVDLQVALDQLCLAQQHGLGDSTPAFGGNDKNLREHSKNSVRYVVFEVEQQLFAIPLDGVEEIDRCGKVTALPRAPEWLRGITNLRGKIFSVTDFRRLLKLDSESPLTGEKIIVIQSKSLETRTALVVDRVLGIRHLDATADSAKILDGVVAAFASGISTVQAESIVLIQPDLLLGCNDLQSFSDS